MRSLYFYLILSGLLLQVFCRPQKLEEEEDNGEVEETEYEEDKSDDGANLNEEHEHDLEEDEEGDHLSEYAPNEQKIVYEDQPGLTSDDKLKSTFEEQRNSNNLSNNKRADEGETSRFSNSQMEYVDQLAPNTDMINENDNQPSKNLNNMCQVNKYESPIFEKQVSPYKYQKEDFNKDEKREERNLLNDDNNFDDSEEEDEIRDYLRDRRGANNSIEKTTTSSTNVEKSETDNEDEELTIKKQIKKLSTDEFNELLNSLPEDKKSLLKKIFDNDVDYLENVKKREITKKAGAMEENNLVEGNQVDGSNLQASSIPAECSSMATSTESKKDTSTESTKISHISSDINNGGSGEANVFSASDTTINSYSQNPTKSENKRETNDEDFQIPDRISYDSIKLLEDEYQTKESKNLPDDQCYLIQESGIDTNRFSSKDSKSDPNSNSDLNYLKSFKTLEESFPNSYDESGYYVGPSAGPLIRVKRKDSDKMLMKKKAVAFLPDTKVAYFPYKSENEEEDSNEGNEFDNDGFYDRISNIALGNSKLCQENIPEEQHEALQTKKMNQNTETIPKNKFKSDCVGSDIERVISGTDGVDDKELIKRTLGNLDTYENNVETADKNISKQQRRVRSTPLIDGDMETASQNLINTQSYEVNDAFGALPRNYEGELGRFKRIRHIIEHNDIPEVIKVSNI